MLKAYLQAVADVGEGAARRAAEAARQALAGAPGTGELPAAGPGVDELAGQGAALVHELMARTRRQREALRDVVRAEFETLVSQAAGRESTSLAVQLAASQARVRELERELAKVGGATPTAPIQPSTSAPKASAPRAGAKIAPAKAAPAKAAPARGKPARVMSGPASDTRKGVPAKGAPVKATRKAATTAGSVPAVRGARPGRSALDARRPGALPPGTDGLA